MMNIEVREEKMEEERRAATTAVVVSSLSTEHELSSLNTD